METRAREDGGKCDALLHVDAAGDVNDFLGPDPLSSAAPSTRWEYHALAEFAKAMAHVDAAEPHTVGSGVDTPATPIPRSAEHKVLLSHASANDNAAALVPVRQ
jgi:hypothetical protein